MGEADVASALMLRAVGGPNRTRTDDIFLVREAL